MKHPDYDRAFHDTPEYIRSAIELGFVKGKKAMKMRYKVTSALSIAAALVVILGAAAFGASRLGGRPDNRLPGRPLSGPVSTATLAPEAPTPGVDSTPSSLPMVTPEPTVTPEITPEPTLLPEVTPEPAEEIESAALDVVYYTTSGLYFHAESDCSGMQGATEGSVQDAYHAAKEPCPICLADWRFEVRAMPVETPEPIWESQIVYTAAEDDQFFHREEFCEAQTNSTSVSVSAVLQKGMEPCAVCLPETTYALVALPDEDAAAAVDGIEILYSSAGAQYFHVDPDCSGMQNADPYTVRALFADHKTACPVCMAGWRYAIISRETDPEVSPAPTVIPESTAEFEGATPEPTAPGNELDLQMVWSGFDINSDDIVYVTPAGNYFHFDPECSGMADAQETAAGIAYLHDMRPCPICAPAAEEEFSETLEVTVAPTMFAVAQDESEEIVVETAPEGNAAYTNVIITSAMFYYTPRGNYYHILHDCSGMQGASAHPLNEAIEAGKRHCPVCIGDSVEYYWQPVPEHESDAVCVFSEDESHYHVDPECSDLGQVEFSTLYQAEALGLTHCPVCLPAMNSSEAE